MTLPDLPQVVPVDPAQLQVRDLAAGNNHPVGPDGHFAHCPVATREGSPSRDAIPSFPPGLLHGPPPPSLGQGACGCADAAIVPPGEPQECFHGQAPFLRGQLDLLGILPAKAHVGG